MKVHTAGQVIYKVSWVSAPANREAGDLCYLSTVTRWEAADTAADQVLFARTSAAVPDVVNSWLLTAPAAAAAAEAGDGKSGMREAGRR